MQLHTKTHVRLVAAIFANHVLVKHVRKRSLRRDSRDTAGTHHHLFDHMKNIFLPWKRHFQVELREFRLAVGAQVFIAKAFDDLEVPIESANHQNLFKDLRRLWQRVKMPLMHAAWHQIIASPFGCRAREHRSFNLNKAHLVHGFADFEDNLVAQRQVRVRFRSAQIQIPKA